VARIVIWSPERSLGVNLIVTGGFAALAWLAIDWPSPEVDEAAVAAMRSRVKFEILQSWSRELEIEPGKGDPGRLQELSRRIGALGAVEVRVEATKRFGRDTIARVRVTVDGRPPPDGRAERYFRVARALFFVEGPIVTPTAAGVFAMRPW
jgi:hypothetical protein